MPDVIPPLQIKTGLQVGRPPAEVFQAIVDPAKAANYFLAHGSGPLMQGATVYWSFPEMEGSFPIRVISVVENKLVQFLWNDVDGSETTVTIELKPVDKNRSFVTVTEGEKSLSAEGIRWLKSNTEGWANYLACLKAYLEYGINLRKGAFDPSQMPTTKDS